MDQALAVFQAKALQNCEFQGCFPKTEVLGKPQLIQICPEKGVFIDYRTGAHSPAKKI
jgi:hypothetical protein